MSLIHKQKLLFCTLVKKAQSVTEKRSSPVAGRSGQRGRTPTWSDVGGRPALLLPGCVPEGSHAAPLLLRADVNVVWKSSTMENIRERNLSRTLGPVTSPGEGRGGREAALAGSVPLLPAPGRAGAGQPESRNFRAHKVTNLSVAVEARPKLQLMLVPINLSGHKDVLEDALESTDPEHFSMAFRIHHCSPQIPVTWSFHCSTGGREEATSGPEGCGVLLAHMENTRMARADKPGDHKES